MKENQHIYWHLGSHILRTPIFPYQDVRLHDYSKPLFQEAIYLASSDLFTEIEKDRQHLSEKEQETLCRYWSRASTRSTPFGLFATCSVGKIGGENQIEIKAADDVKRVTLLASEVLYSLSRSIEEKLIDKGIKFYPNDSIYEVDDRIRYVERDGDDLLLQSVKNNQVLSGILHQARKGCDIEELLTINARNHSKEALRKYIHDLIKNGILVSELNPSVYGEDTMVHIIEICQKYDAGQCLLNRLKSIKSSLEMIDGALAHNDMAIDRIKENLHELGVEWKGALIQSDCFREYENVTLSESVVDDVAGFIDILCACNKPAKRSLEAFQKEFEKRYGDAHVPLLLAMDNELGIGYPVGHISYVRDGILAGIGEAKVMKDASAKRLSDIEISVLKKVLQASRNNSDVEEICLTNDDFIKGEGSQLKDGMPTINVLCSIYIEGGNRVTIDLKHVGGSSAANLIGRFCHLDKAFIGLSDLIKQKDEEAGRQGRLVAEIVHLPMRNVINIIHRPEMRSAFIHYLGSAGNTAGVAISASDLMLRSQRGKLRLFSKDHGEIIPVLSNAHNYKMGKSDVYQFLCDYQYYTNIGPSMPAFDNLFNMIGYLPRIKYKNIIISKRKWIVTEAADGCPGEQWRMTNGIPDKVVIKEYDNELFIDFSDKMDRTIFVKMLKRKKKLEIEEILFSESDLIINKGNSKYCGEFIIPLYRTR